jgi:colanic acid biosynthesis glycosyl transferase WcaI
MHFRRKGVPDRKLLLFPSGVVLLNEANLPARDKFRGRHRISQNEFVAVYAGNLGVKQGLGVLLEAAESLRHDAIRILICGNGAERELLTRRISGCSLTNVMMLPLQASDTYAELLVDADLCLITQQAGSGNAFLPSKLLTTLAYAKPVVTVADPESALAGAVASGCFGINVRPNDPRDLATTLRNLARDRSQLNRWGRAGRDYVEQFEQDRVLAVFLTELKALGNDSNPA